MFSIFAVYVLYLCYRSTRSCFSLTSEFSCQFRESGARWGTRIIAEENSNFMVENVYYDGKWNLKLSIYFTK